MKTWSAPSVPDLDFVAAPLRLRNEQSGDIVEVPTDQPVGVYVCGITPYDTTHLGHAATYITFDLAIRALRAAGHEVTYVQNVTDVDDPLLERATRDGINWRDLAHREIELFHGDMVALRNVPPQHYVGVVETMPRHIAVITQLLKDGAAYGIPVDPEEAGAREVQDIYLDLSKQPSFGKTSGWSREQMLEVFADRGGDPDRPGKRDVLDPLLWRGQRIGEPHWDSAELGPGRPGWHLECTTIALDFLGMGFTLQGGGSDLVFPHHEMSAVQAEALTGSAPFAHRYAHQAMVGYDGEKMSKSKGNLVRVSDLRAMGEDPMAIRLVLLDKHYSGDWEYTDDLLSAAKTRLAAWREAVARAGDDGADEVTARISEALANDLDSPVALAAVDQWAAAHRGKDAGPSPRVTDAIDALLGVAV